MIALLPRAGQSIALRIGDCDGRVGAFLAPVSSAVGTGTVVGREFAVLSSRLKRAALISVDRR
jgi:hypothetical protein